MKHRIASLSAAALLAAACATPASIKQGDSEAAVRTKVGAPTETRVGGDGRQAWEYWGGVRGRNTYIVRFDADGKVATVDRPMREEVFRLLNGLAQEDVRDRLGRPSYRYTVPLGEVWEYRIYDEHSRAAKMSVQFDPKERRVTEVSKQLEEFLQDEAAFSIGVGGGWGRR